MLNAVFLALKVRLLHKGGKIALEKIDKDHLPEAMKKMTLVEQKAYLLVKLDERKKTLAKIQEISIKRDAFLKKEENVSSASLNRAILHSLRKQAKEAGLSIP